MDYSTPGVYIREVDSGAKPIASVATSVPGFLGLFEHKPTPNSLQLSAKDGSQLLTGKIPLALVDKKGNITGNAVAATNEITSAMKLKKSQVKDLNKFLNLHGVKVGGKTGASIAKKDKNVEVSFKGKSVLADASVLAVDGKILSSDEAAIDELLNDIASTFNLVASPKSAADILDAYGYSFDSAEETSLDSQYSIPPYAVTNKAEFFRWLRGFFAQYLFDTHSTEELLGEKVEDPDEAVDAIFDRIDQDDNLKKKFYAFLSQESVFNFVTGVNGFYDNGGGKAYVYLMGSESLSISIREDQENKVGLYAFDDVEDMAIMATPGLSFNHQRELLEHCETRKDRFAVLDGPIVSDGSMDIPASAKGYGAMYVPWFKVTKPSWFTGEQEITVTGPNRRKLIKTDKSEVFIPPSGHICGIMARVDTERGVHKAPANEVVMGITGISQSINRIEQGQYNDRGINVVREFKDRGIRVWGARTLATKSDPSWKYINVRRLFIMIEQSILLGSQWAVFEPNDQTLWKKLTRDVRAYLMRVWRSGALFGATAEEAFYVKCDPETNPRYLIDAGQVNVQVGICPVKPAEFVIFSIGQWDGGALIEE
jgi:phage tail sheath protein FI